MSGGMINLVIHLKSSLFNGEIVANLESRLEAGGEPRVGSAPGSLVLLQQASTRPRPRQRPRWTKSPTVRDSNRTETSGTHWLTAAANAISMTAEERRAPLERSIKQEEAALVNVTRQFSELVVSSDYGCLFLSELLRA